MPDYANIWKAMQATALMRGETTIILLGSQYPPLVGCGTEADNSSIPSLLLIIFKGRRQPLKKLVLSIAMLLMVLAFAGGALAYVPYNNVWGTQYSETLYGTGGNDWIFTKSGEDTVYAGEGDDRISTHDGSDP